MADPRKTLSFKDIGYLAVTFRADATLTFDATLPGGNANVGKAVQLTTVDQTVKLGTDGAPFLGKLINVTKDGFAVVQIQGFMSIAGVTVLGAGVQCAASGAVKTGTRGIVIDDTNPGGWFFCP